MLELLATALFLFNELDRECPAFDRFRAGSEGLCRMLLSLKKNNELSYIFNQKIQLNMPTRKKFFFENTHFTGKSLSNEECESSLKLIR